MQITINKKSIIIFIAFIIFDILLFAGGYVYGRNRRLSAISDSRAEAEQAAETNKQRAEQLEKQLADRIIQCEQLEQQLDGVGVGIDESIRAAGSIRAEIEQGRRELSGSNKIIAELRSRFGAYENRIERLESDLKELKASIN